MGGSDMALRDAIPVAFEVAFPHGAFLAPGSEVEKVRDWDRSKGDNFVQAADRETGLPLWSIVVVDGDPDARKHEKAVEVRIVAKVQPVPPQGPFSSVEFEGLSVRPYIAPAGDRGRLAWSYRATGMKAFNGA